LLDLGTLAQEEDYQQAGDYFQAALALARTRQEPSALAHTLNWLGRWHSMMDQPDEARQLQGEALAIFQRLDDRQGMAVTLSLLGWSNYVAADLYASVDAYSQAIALCRQNDDRPWLIFSLAGRAMRGRDNFNLVACWPPADRAGAERDVAEAIQLAQQMGYRSGEVRTLIWSAVGLGAAGECGRALAAAQSALQIAREDQQSRYIATVYHALGSLYLDLLALPAAQEQLAACLQRSEAIKSLTMSRYAAGLLAAVAIGQQRLDEAERLLDRALPVDAPTTSKTQRLIGCTRVELLLARDQPSEALAWVDRLLASAVAPPVADRQADEWIIPRLWHLRGAALFALHRSEEAEAVLQTARRVAESQGMRPLLWRIQASLARLYQQQRRRDLAFSALSAAQTMIEELALSVDDLPLRQNFVQQANELLPNLSPPTPLRAAKLSSDGLTARERQVGALIAQGQSNRAIAQGLIISERTVAKHVENILSKLHFTTRVQIAAWAVEKGLLAEEA
jgi:DNA-binding NarL/FixJ family response regulator